VICLIPIAIRHSLSPSTRAWQAKHPIGCSETLTRGYLTSAALLASTTDYNNLFIISALTLILANPNHPPAIGFTDRAVLKMQSIDQPLNGKILLITGGASGEQ
jgi:hypothetical protein